MGHLREIEFVLIIDLRMFRARYDYKSNLNSDLLGYT